MDDRLRRLFQMEVIEQCRFAVLAAQDLNTALKAGDMENIWYAVHGFLTAAANVSKLLWPVNERIAGRGEVLRKSFLVPEDSPLKSRKLRNQFEHFDEHLETWAMTSKNRNIIDRGVGDPSKIQLSSLESGDYVRFINTKDGTIIFRGEAYVVQPIADATQAILAGASSAMGSLDNRS